MNRIAAILVWIALVCSVLGLILVMGSIALSEGMFTTTTVITILLMADLPSMVVRPGRIDKRTAMVFFWHSEARIREPRRDHSLPQGIEMIQLPDTLLLTGIPPGFAAFVRYVAQIGAVLIVFGAHYWRYGPELGCTKGDIFQYAFTSQFWSQDPLQVPFLGVVVEILCAFALQQIGMELLQYGTKCRKNRDTSKHATLPSWCSCYSAEGPLPTMLAILLFLEFFWLGGEYGFSGTSLIDRRMRNFLLLPTRLVHPDKFYVLPVPGRSFATRGGPHLLLLGQWACIAMVACDAILIVSLLFRPFAKSRTIRHAMSARVPWRDPLIARQFLVGFLYDPSAEENVDTVGYHEDDVDAEQLGEDGAYGVGAINVEGVQQPMLQSQQGTDGHGGYQALDSPPPSSGYYSDFWNSSKVDDSRGLLQSEARASKQYGTGAQSG